jgi:hypothetical protein
MLDGWKLSHRWSMVLRSAFIIAVSLRYAEGTRMENLLQFIDNHLPPPSYAIALLAALAVVMTLVLPKEPSNGDKAAWMAVAFFLMIIEMMAMNHDRKAQDQKYLSDRKTQNEQFERSYKELIGVHEDTKGIRTDVQVFRSQTFKQSNEIAEKQNELAMAIDAKLKAALAVPEKSVAAVGSPVAPKQDNHVLKAEALQVAKDITDWLVLISGDVPSDASLSHKFLERINSEWEGKFSSRASSTLGKLQMLKAAPTNIHACMAGLPVTDSLMMLNFRKMCATDLENGAEKLN